MSMSAAEMRVEIDRISLLITSCAPPDRDALYKSEISKLPQEAQGVIAAAIATHVIIYEKDTSMTTEKWVATGLGTFFVVGLLLIAIYIPHPTPSQDKVFNAVLAVALGAVAATVPGILELKGVWNSFQVRATGALAVFFIVYAFNPASRVTTPAEPADADKTVHSSSVSTPSPSP